MELQQAIADLGFEVSFVHVPTEYEGFESKLRFIGTVTLSAFGGHRRLIGGFPYFMGIYHVPAFVNRTNARTGFINMESAPKIQHELRTGKTYKNGKWVDITPPNVADFLHCLLLDGEADNMTFEDWCDNYGYDTDSRKALAMYEECREIGMIFRTSIHRDILDELKTLLADY